MNKNILLFLLVALCFSCKEKKIGSKEVILESANKADFGDLYQYYHANPNTLAQKEENKIIEYAADNNMEAVRTISGIYITDHAEGAGDSVRWGDPITVHYRGYFLDGQEFDSSLKKDKPISFRVGTMVAGWNEALPYLKVGSKATFLIPSHMGYGEKGFPGFIDPNKILIFDIEILSKGE